MLALFTIIHPFVDACSVSVLIAGGMTWERVIAYNAMAFALQLPAGVFMDCCPHLNRIGFFAGTGMVITATVLAAIGFGGWGVLAVVCIGNALFHLTAGKNILETREGRAGPIGFFIATGALGLMAGQVWAAKTAATCLWIFAAVLAVLVALALAMKWETCGRMIARKQSDDRMLRQMLALGALFVLIAWRSWAGLLVSGRSADECVFMMCAGAAVSFAGKVFGGYLSECSGRWRVVVASVLGSAALAFMHHPSWTAVWLILLFVAQLATGPVLSLVYDRTERRGGLAFGLNCFGLFAGSLA